jgi:hypothetical protein
MEARVNCSDVSESQSYPAPQLMLEKADVRWRALRSYRSSKADFSDAVIVELGRTPVVRRRSHSIETRRRIPIFEALRSSRYELGATALCHSFDPPILADMLKSLAGRDLLLVMGSVAADSMVYDLTATVRLWNAVWHGPGRVSRRPPELEHPLGSIKLRVLSG